MKVEITNIKNPGTPWLWIGLALLLINMAVVGWERWEFPYGLVYAFACLSLGIVLSSDEGGVLGGLSAAISGFLAAWIQISLAYYTDVYVYALICVVLFIFVLLDEGGYISFGRTRHAKYLTLAAFLAMFLFPATYFYQRIILHMELNAATILYHGGIMALALSELVTLIGSTTKSDAYYSFKALLAILAVIGAFVLTAVYGWGLTLIK